MAMSVPVGGRRFHGLDDLGPAFKAAALESECAQDFPPGLDQVEVSRVGGLEEKVPARMGQGEKQHVGCPMGREVIYDDKEILWPWSHPLIHLSEEVHPVGRGAPRVGQSKSLATLGFKRAEDVAFAAPSVIDLLPGTAGRPPRSGRGSNRFSPWIALGRLWSHFIQAEHDALLRRGRVEPLDGRLFFGRSRDRPSPCQTRFPVCASAGPPRSRSRPRGCA